MSGDAGQGTPVIPPIPSEAARRAKRLRKPPMNLRPLIWISTFVLGMALGVVAYRYVPSLDFYFDYWLALVMS